MVKTDGPHHLELYRAIDTGNFHVLAFDELDGNRAHAATRPIDEDLLAGSERSGGRSTDYTDYPDGQAPYAGLTIATEEGSC